MTTIEKRTTIETTIETLNAMIREGKSHNDCTAFIAGINEEISQLNTMMTAEQFTTMRNAENPMETAIRTLETNAVQCKLNKESGKYELSDTSRIIDLAKFDRFCDPKTIAHDSSWVYKVGNLARLFAAYATNEVGGDWQELLNSYWLRKQDFRSPEANPISKKTLTRELQKIVDAIIFVDNGKGLNQYKVTSWDVAFIVLCSCKQGKKPKTITMPKDTTITKLLIQVINRIMTGDSYEVLYKRNNEN